MVAARRTKYERNLYSTGCTGAYKSLAVAARKLQKQLKLAGASSRGAFALIDQAPVELSQGGAASTFGHLVPVMVPKPMAKGVHDFANSLAVHAVHCSQMQEDVHFAQTALQLNRGQREEVQVGTVRTMHRIANAAKHDGSREVEDQLLSGEFNAESCEYATKSDISKLVSQDSAIISITMRGLPEPCVSSVPCVLDV